MEIQKLEELGLARKDPPPKPRNELGQDQFLKLMTVQMTHQNPMKPMENAEFLTQMAQFGTVSGIQQLQKSFADFAASIGSDQALQATNLVGRQVLATANRGILPAGGELSGALQLDKPATSVTVQIVDSAGVTVKTIDLGPQDAGKAAFTWDGLKDDGTLADPGSYQIRAEGLVDGQNQALETQVVAAVESVSMGQGGLGVKVNLAGIGSVDFKQIQQIL